MSSKGKKRVVLPTRPEPPSVEQILEDIRSTQPSDPMFVLLAENLHDPFCMKSTRRWEPVSVHSNPTYVIKSPSESEVKSERLYQQSHSYVEMNQRLQKACSLLKAKCEELKQAGATLEQNIRPAPKAESADSNGDLAWRN
uniref:Chromosome 19 open reading frame 25 n=1 Tax=Chrysemys picta bellii TaxID=8478 RepID=A0A8C3HE55_CHRPI